ncbi:MAG: hypothetical protein H6746_16215 [Deltaproteobacteria bacterium]|nr:hypothetical protein [Deltaproteobacteria bacterium]
MLPSLLAPCPALAPKRVRPLAASPNGKKSLFERFLALFAEVRAGEGLLVTVLALDVFLVLVAYYLVKVVREPLILVGGGAELKSYAAAGQAVLLIGVVKAIDVMARRFGRLRLMATSWLFFASNLVLFYFLALWDVPIGFVFFLWVGVFSVSVLAQFWSFANDLYTPAQGKRLFAIVGIGASAGAVFGSKLADLLIDPSATADGADRSLYRLMLYAAGILLVALALTAFADKRAGDVEPREASAEQPVPDRIGGPTALTLIRRDRYLLLIALLVLLLNWVNSTGEYILSRMVEGAAHEASAAAWEAGRAAATMAESAFREGFEKTYIGDFYATFFTWVNALGAGIQLFLVSRILRYVGVRVAIMVLPTIALIGYGAILVLPVLAVARVAKIAENSIDYSLQNTAQQALFLVTSRAAKYKAKAFIDTVMKRAGDVLQALVVWVGTSLAFGIRHFVIVAMVLAVCWLITAIAIGRRHHVLEDESDAEG